MTLIHWLGSHSVLLANALSVLVVGAGALYLTVKRSPWLSSTILWTAEVGLVCYTACRFVDPYFERAHNVTNLSRFLALVAFSASSGAADLYLLWRAKRARKELPHARVLTAATVLFTAAPLLAMCGIYLLTDLRHQTSPSSGHDHGSPSFWLAVTFAATYLTTHLLVIAIAALGLGDPDASDHAQILLIISGLAGAAYAVLFVLIRMDFALVRWSDTTTDLTMITLLVITYGTLALALAILARRISRSA